MLRFVLPLFLAVSAFGQIPFCARAFNLSDTRDPNTAAALDDFVKRFGLEVRDYQDERGYQDK